MPLLVKSSRAANPVSIPNGFTVKLPQPIEKNVLSHGICLYATYVYIRKSHVHYTVYMHYMHSIKMRGTMHAVCNIHVGLEYYAITLLLL